MKRILGPAFKGKGSLLLDWTKEYRDVADPWYTDNFDETFDDVWRGCNAILERLK
jgi:protein-tyrosine phosphatase